MNFNNIDLSERFTITAVRGRGIVQYEINSTSIPRRKGSRYRNKRRPSRTLEVDIVVLGNSPEDLRKNIDQINTVLAVDEEKGITFPDEPNMTYYGMPEQSTENNEIVSTNETTLVFVCHDPDKIGRLRTETQSEINVLCNAPVMPYITATIPEAVSYITFELGNKILTMHAELNIDDVVEINVEKEVVYINGNQRNETIDIEESDFLDRKSVV